MDLKIAHFNFQRWFVFLAAFLPCCQGYREFQICDVDEECPVDSICYRDDCARCECPAGQSVTNYIVGTKIIKMCSKDELFTKVGDDCSKNSYNCPYGSRCDDVNKICVCKKGLVEHEDNTYCRPAIFGERCGHATCDEELGLKCHGHPPLCTCADSYHSADGWTQYINERWQYSRIGVLPQNCVPRSVGEPCRHNTHCTAIAGSGAECRCHYCQCKIDHHVPDIHGLKCGPALTQGDDCDFRSARVCDGTRGLQCGDECDYYRYNERRKTCSCSAMHDNKGGTCLPKIAGSSCRADLDCYLLVGGFGICENQTCKLAENSTEHIPRTLHRKCHRRKDTTQNPVTMTTTLFNQSRDSSTNSPVFSFSQLNDSSTNGPVFNFSQSKTTKAYTDIIKFNFLNISLEEGFQNTSDYESNGVQSTTERTANVPSNENAVETVYGNDLGSSQSSIQTKSSLILLTCIILCMSL